MVTKKDYQRGVKRYADFYKIGLKVLRKPSERDWVGRVRDIRFDIVALAVASSEETPLRTTIALRPKDDEQEKRLKNCKAPTCGAEFRFLDENGMPSTEEMRWWLPESIDVLEKEPGGPYQEKIPLSGKFVSVECDDGSVELVEAIGIIVDFYVEELERNEFVVHGEEVVQAVLKDALTDKVEHVHRSSADEVE